MLAGLAGANDCRFFLFYSSGRSQTFNGVRDWIGLTIGSPVALLGSLMAAELGGGWMEGAAGTDIGVPIGVAIGSFLGSALLSFALGGLGVIVAKSRPRR